MQLPTLDRLKLFIQVCNAVQHAHQKGIIHRDLKPSNILVTLHDGVPVPKVIDFGIAKATQQELTDKTVYTQLQQFIGTPAYISPEQAEMSGLDIDTRADIYSLGVLLYELLAGSTPFDARELLASGLDAMRRTIREKEPVRPSTRLTQQLEVAKVNSLPPAAGLAIPTPQEVSHDSRRRLRLKEQIALLKGDLDWIVMKCLEKDRTRRYDTANGLAADVQRHLSNEPVIARPPSTLYRFQKMARRNKLAFAATTAVLTALVLGITVSAWQAVRASRESATARRAETAARRAETVAQTEARRADDESARATAASTAARQSLAAADFYQATRLVDADNASEALPFLARSLSLNPTNPAARTRLFTLLNYRTWLMPRQVLTNAGHTEFATFSPDGGRILTVSKTGEARVWDAETERPLTGVMICYSNKTDNFMGELPFEFSSDGKRILTLSSAREIQVWDAQTGRLMTPPFGSIDKRHGSAHFNADATRVVGVVDNLRVQTWDAQTGRPVVGPFGDEAMMSVRYNSDGSKILSTSMTTHGRVWDAQTGQPVTARFEQSDVSHFVWSADGSRIVTGSGRPPYWSETTGSWATYGRPTFAAQVWDANIQQPLGPRMQHDGNFWGGSMCFNPEETRIITSGRGHEARVWNTTNGELAFALQHPKYVSAASFIHGGKRILTCSDQSDYLRVWDALSGQPLTELYPMRDWGSWLGISSHGKRVMSVDQDGRIWMFDGRTEIEPARMLSEPKGVTLAKISPNGRQILTVATNSIITLWDAESGRGSVLTSENVGEVRAKFSRDGERILVVSGTNTAQAWNAKTRQPLAPPKTFGPGIASLTFSPDGEWIATVTTNGTIAVLNAHSGKESWSKAHGADNVWFSPDGRFIALGENSQLILDASTGEEKELPRLEGSWSSPQFSPAGDRFLQEGGDGGIQVHDTSSGSPVLSVLGMDMRDPEAVFSLDGQQILAHGFQTNGSSNLQLWDANTGAQIAGPFPEAGGGTNDFLEDHLLTPGQLTLDGRWLVTVSTNGQACLWNLSPPPGALPGWMPDLLEALSGKVLNAHGVLEPTQRDSAQLLASLRTQSAAAPPTDEWSAWLRWFLADRATRSPYPLTP